jgi:hypothetical protein
MAATTLPVELLCRIDADTVSIPPQFVNGGPQGTRMIASVAGGTFEGPKMKGTVPAGAAGDWVTIRPDGSFRLDVRLTLVTDDGATILCTYNGIGRSDASGATTLHTAPLFEVGDERYAWLNHVQAVGFGTVDGSGVHYDVYALTGSPS